MLRSSIHLSDCRSLATSIAQKLAICTLLLFSTAVSGCGGCSRDEVAENDKAGEQKDDAKPDAEKPEEKKEKPPPYEFVEPSFNVLPSDETISRRAVKPGHWFTVAHHIKANEFDFYGELESQVLDGRQRALEIEHTNYDLLVTRPVAVPKGEVKHIDATYFVPRQQQADSQQFWLHFPFKTRGGSQLSLKDHELAIRMPPFQFFFVVLSGNPDRYVFLRSMPSVKSPGGSWQKDHLNYYRVVLPKIQSGQLPLSENALNWTTVAYLLWDNLDPATFRSEQQSALLDWLHWGGQIIVSGPNSLDGLRGSFLDPYLPATQAGAAELTASRFGELNREWSLQVSRKEDFESQLTVPENSPIAGVELELCPGATFLPKTGQLVAERQVGRGRIVVTAFPLADRSIVRWGNLDGFFNACLLRRPSRRFDQTASLSATWQPHPGLARDPLLASTLRYFSRDMRPITDPDAQEQPQPNPWDEQLDWSDPEASNTPTDRTVLASPHTAHMGQNTEIDDWHFGGFWYWRDSGVAGWNDESGVANAARQTLKEAAGIVPPDRKDVLLLLAIYLTVLVPINWFVFRVIRRVELAWLMMPLIAIVGAVVVVWRAQLDIGFVRSRTEVAVLEVRGGYSRAHLSRYTALYSSLTTSFDFTFDDDTVQAQPFALTTETDPRRDSDDRIGTLHFRHDRNTSLSGYRVKSNSTGILHSEQMYDLGGTIQLGDDGQGLRLANQSRHSLNDVGVMRRTDTGVEVAWVGQLPAASVQPLKFRRSAGDEVRLSEWNRSPAMLSFEVEARQLLQQFDANYDKVLDRFEADKIERIKDFFEQADGRQLSRSQDDASGSVRRDERLSQRELEFCCMLARDGKVGLGRFLDLTVQRLRLGNGEVRLIGWTDQELGGISIDPDVSQTRTQTFVIVHLQPMHLREAQADTNHIADFTSDGEGGNLYLFDSEGED